MDKFERRFEPVEVVSTELELPKVILGIPWALSLIMVRDRIQGSSILRTVSRNDANNVRVWPHNDAGVASWNTPPPTVSNDAGRKVGPTVEVKT